MEKSKVLPEILFCNTIMLFLKRCVKKNKTKQQQQQQQAIADFRARVLHYEKMYETVEEPDYS
jgi:hypothetical protein